MKRNLNAVCALSLTGLLLFSLSGCGSDNKGPSKPAGTQKLTIYWGALEDFMAADVAAFEKETGIKVTAVRMSSGETLQRLKAEKEAPKASVWFGGPADGQIQAKADGLLEKYVSPNAAKIPDRFRDRDGFWTGVYVGYLGFASNGRLLKEKKQKLERPAEARIPGTDRHAQPQIFRHRLYAAGFHVPAPW